MDHLSAASHKSLSMSALFLENEHLLDLKSLFDLSAIRKFPKSLLSSEIVSKKQSFADRVSVGNPLSLISKSKHFDKHACQSTNGLCEKHNMTTVEDVTGLQVKSGRQKLLRNEQNDPHHWNRQNIIP